MKNEEPPLSLFFLKSVVAGLGIILIVGFTFIVGVLLLGGKYFVEQSEFTPYNLSKKIHIDPLPQGTIISAKTSPVGIEILHKYQDTYYLSVYEGQGGTLLSKIFLQKPHPTLQALQGQD